MDKYIIKYSSFFSYLIWFLPRQCKEKSVELVFTGNGATFKSDNHSGTAKKINKHITMIVRYSFVFLLLLFLFPEKQKENWLFEFSLLIGIFIPFFFLKIPFLKINQLTVSFVAIGIIAAICLVAYFVNDLYFAVKALAFSAQNSIFFWRFF